MTAALGLQAGRSTLRPGGGPGFTLTCYVQMRCSLQMPLDKIQHSSTFVSLGGGG